MNIIDIFIINTKFILLYSPLIVLIFYYAIIGSVSLFYSKKYIIRRNISELPFVSLVIPTYNEEDIISSRLSSLLYLTYPRNKMEIIITDSSSDNTPLLIEEFMKNHKEPPIKLIHDNIRRGLAIALNKAYEQCKGDIIVKIDSDIVLEKDALLNIVSNFSNPAIGAVTGKMKVSSDSSKEVSYRDIQDIIQRAETYIDSIYMAHPFSAYRRILIRQYEPYHYGDETIQTIHIRRQGYKVCYDPSSIFYEHVTDSLKQKIRRAEGHIMILIENIDMLFNPKYGKFGLYVFPSNFFMIIISPLLLLVSLILIVIDLIIFRYAMILDIFIIILILSIIAARKRFNSIWMFINLQYAQLRTILNFVMGRNQSKWEKIKRSA